MKILRILGILAALLIVAAIALPFLIDVNQFRPRLESELTTALGRQVSVGNLKLSLFSGSVAAADVSIADDPAFSKTPFLQAKTLSAGVELWPLIVSRKIIVTGITIDSPEIALLQSPDGAWNYTSLGGKPAESKAASPASSTSPASPSTPIDLTVKLVKIANGRLTVGKTSGQGKPIILDQAVIELQEFSPTSVMPFSFFSFSAIACLSSIRPAFVV